MEKGKYTYDETLEARLNQIFERQSQIVKELEKCTGIPIPYKTKEDMLKENIQIQYGINPDELIRCKQCNKFVHSGNMNILLYAVEDIFQHYLRYYYYPLCFTPNYRGPMILHTKPPWPVRQSSINFHSPFVTDIETRPMLRKYHRSRIYPQLSMTIRGGE